MLTEVLREIQPDYLLPDPEQLSVEAVDQDPLSPESLAGQTERLIKLIQRAREVEDATLVRSLRRELLLTRWALVKSIGSNWHFAKHQRPRGIAKRQSPIASDAELSNSSSLSDQSGRSENSAT